MSEVVGKYCVVRSHNGALSKVVKWSPLSLRYIVHLHTECHIWVNIRDVQGEGRLPNQGDGGAVNGNIHFSHFIK